MVRGEGEGVEGHLVVGGTIGARITPYQLAPGTIHTDWGPAPHLPLPWRHLEEDSSSGVPGDHVRCREGVGVSPDWLRPDRIRTSGHIRAGRFLKYHRAPVWNMTIGLSYPPSVFWKGRGHPGPLLECLPLNSELGHILGIRDNPGRSRISI